MIIVFAYLIVLLINNSIYVYFVTFDGDELKEKKIKVTINLITIMFWSYIEFTVCFEWEVITALVEFQSGCSLAEMGVQKRQFNE